MLIRAQLLKFKRMLQAFFWWFIKLPHEAHFALIGLVVIVLLAWLRFGVFSGAALAQQLQSVQNTLSVYQEELSNLSQRSPVRLGELDSTAEYQVGLAEVAAKNVAIKPDIPSWRLSIATQSNSPIKLEQDLRQYRDDIQAYLQYTYEVNKALQKAYEYNPTADFNGIDFNGESADARLERARTGLAKVLADVEAIKTYPGDNLQPVRVEVQKLQKARDEFDNNRDLQRWVDACKEVQGNVLVNRMEFEDRRTRELLGMLNELRSRVSGQQSLLR